ncbi:unnamed protein product, partial [Rotaria magnacalcarata]
NGKYIKRILDVLFNDIITNLENLPNYDVDKAYKDTTISKLNKVFRNFIYLKEKNISLKDYISLLFTWVKYILFYRDLIIENKCNPKLKTIEDFQEYRQLVYH